MMFRDRIHAGQLLAKKLSKYKNKDAIVLALPRGGVPLAAEIADFLQLPLDVLIVRKVGAPFNSELAVGAICEMDEPIFNDKILSRIGLEPGDLRQVIKSEKAEVQRQIQEFRNGQALSEIAKKVVIIVDDGLATGATALAAVNYLRKKGVGEIVVAVPVAAASSARSLRTKVDDLVAVEESENLMSVGEWYRDFSQVSDREVISSLRKSQPKSLSEEAVKITISGSQLEGDLIVVPQMKAMIIFAHGSGSSRKSPRNQQVAQVLNKAGFGTLLFDLLTEEESKDRKNVFNIEFLSQRLVAVTQWLRQREDFAKMAIGFFGASTGAAAALQAAAKLTSPISAKESLYCIVSRGGRPDLAGEALEQVQIPTLLLVGGHDESVIELNQYAQKKLANSKLIIIPGATHLFDEPGTLEEVSQQAALWFARWLPEVSKRPSPSSVATLEEVIEQKLVSFGDADEDSLDSLIQAVKDSRVVMLGEATHGTEDFYRIRRLISQRLIRDHGFKFIAVEGDWPDAYRLHRYIQSGEGNKAKSVLTQNHRWPTWMWANEQVAELAEWMRNQRAGFYGLDVYSLFESIESVIEYLKKDIPALAQEVELHYACFDPYEGDEIAYARSLLKFPQGCASEVVSNLQKLLEIRVNEVQRNGEELFSAQQNARIIANAETYYRSMLTGDANSWNIRDSHMMDTLDRLLERAGEAGKAIVWAHNTHIGDYRATDMSANGYVNLGGLARQSYGEDNVSLVGFGSYEGEVLAGLSWGAPEQVMALPPARPGSYEHSFHQVANKVKTNQFYLVFEDAGRGPLAQTLGHRAVGVVYSPQQESRGNYVPTQLSKRYDAFVFVDRTKALKSFPSVMMRGEFPETWPSGQ